MHGANLRRECRRHFRRGSGELSLDVGKFGIGQGVQRVGRCKRDEVGIQWLRHPSPRHLRNPRMASRIRDLMVARFADSRSETWT